MHKNKSFQQADSAEQHVQLQQKIIHYRSEVSKYKNKIEDFKKEVENEKTKYKLLLNRIKEKKPFILLENESIEEYKNQLEKLTNQLNHYEEELQIKLGAYNEVKAQAEKYQQELLAEKNNNKFDTKLPIHQYVYSYFTYSLILPQIEEVEKNIFLLGSFTIKNTSHVTLHKPVICLRLKPAQCGILSGKIKKISNHENDDDNFFLDDSQATEWQFAQENWKEFVQNKGEYWLNPIDNIELSPGDSLSFSNFDLTLSNQLESNAIIIEGFIYTQEFKEGIPSLNKIVMNF